MAVRVGQLRRDQLEMPAGDRHRGPDRVGGVKVKGVQVPLADFVQTIEQVVRSGVREALRRAVDPQSVWPPDWDDLTLPNT